MSTAVLPAPASTSPPAAPAASPLPYRWTCDEFYCLGGIPSLADKKLILIDGEVLEMAAPGPAHTRAQAIIERRLRAVFPEDRYWIRGQGGMILGINTDPIPDVAVIEGTPWTVTGHPSWALLVIEIADTSLAYDTGDKASLYAAAGVADYWVVDVENRTLHVFRTPTPDAARKYGHGYATTTILGPAYQLAPLAAATRPVTAADLLP